MKCGSIQELLSGYVDKELSATERVLVEAHLTQCTDCQNQLAEIKKMTNLLRTSFQNVVAPLGLEERIAQAIEASHQGVQARRLTVLYLVFALLGGGVITVLVVSPFGMIVRALFRLTVTVVRGGIYMLNSIGHLWLAVLVIFCILLAGSSLVALFRLHRATQSEVVS